MTMELFLQSCIFCSIYLVLAVAHEPECLFDCYPGTRSIKNKRKWVSSKSKRMRKGYLKEEEEEEDSKKAPGYKQGCILQITKGK